MFLHDAKSSNGLPCFIRRAAKLPYGRLGKEPLSGLTHVRETALPPPFCGPEASGSDGRDPLGPCFILRREGDFKNNEATSSVTLGVFREKPVVFAH